ncbi:RDD family protein [Zavarzinella formosa]|uniref:RDD family protein n=1 Tax=Zavarzinella formosa TaxID=360055 RepID=UPI0002FD7726|nr:RDD family protein [Zavarzinella formosa]
MKQPADIKGLGPGVYYAREDYASSFVRLLIIVIDLAIIIALGVVLYFACKEIITDKDDAADWFFWSWFGLTYVYLVFIESSPQGTFGFLLTGMKIVSLNGERPSFLRMTFRLMMWLLGPFHPAIDFLWLSGDPDRQTLRDKFAGTYVVRKNAVPCGKGIVGLRRYFLFGFVVLCREVQRRQANTHDLGESPPAKK